MFHVDVGPQDMGRVRFWPAPAPLLEITTSIRALRRSEGGSGLTALRRRISRCSPGVVHPLLSLLSTCASTPAFLEVLQTDLRVALEVVRATPAARMRHDLERAFINREMPAWIRVLSTGNPDAIGMLIESLREYYSSCLAPCWRQIKAGFVLESDRFSEVQLQHGTRFALGQLHPSVHWRGETLEIQARPEVSMISGGRGVILLPMAPWRQKPLVRTMRDGATLIAYPMRGVQSDDSSRVVLGDGALADLLGPTRAKALCELTEPCGTTELARRINMSLAVTSEHASVLRRAGLIVSFRRGRTVQHTLTRLGRRMLLSEI